jgi:hypothetical protein
MYNYFKLFMADIAHQAERKFVALEVRGSSPLIRPITLIYL